MNSPCKWRSPDDVAYILSKMPIGLVSCCSMLEYDSENLNSEEIYSSLRGVTEAIQNFSFRSQEDLVEPLRRDGKKDGVMVRSYREEPEGR